MALKTKTCQDDLDLKLSGFNSRQAFAGVIKNLEEDLQFVQAFSELDIWRMDVQT